MTQDNRPLRYVERFNEGPDDEPTEQVVYRASSLGACDVQVLATAQGMVGADKPAWFQDVLDEGSLCEGWIASMWEDETGVPTVDEQLEVELYIGDIDDRRVIVRGHIDGREMENSTTLREYKKFRKSTWPNFLAQGIEVNRNYPWQLSVYWHGLGITYAEVVGGHLTGYRDADGVIHDDPGPRNKDGAYDRFPVISEVRCKPVHEAPIAMKDIRARIVRWERLINAGTPLSDGKCEKPYSYPCPFFALHPDDDEPEVYAIAKSNSIVGAAVIGVHEATTEIAELAARMRVLDKQRKASTEILKEQLAAMGEEADTAKVLTYDGLSITRNRGPRKGYTVEDGFTDSFAFTKEDKVKPAKAPAKTPAKKAAAKSTTTTRVGGKK